MRYALRSPLPTARHKMRSGRPQQTPDHSTAEVLSATMRNSTQGIAASQSNMRGLASAASPVRRRSGPTAAQESERATIWLSRGAGAR